MSNLRQIPVINKIETRNGYTLYSIGSEYEYSVVYAICSPKNIWSFWIGQEEHETEHAVESYFRKSVKFPRYFGQDATEIRNKAECRKLLMRLQKMLTRDLLKIANDDPQPLRKTKDTLDPAYWKTSYQYKLNEGMLGIAEVLRVVNSMIKVL